MKRWRKKKGRKLSGVFATTSAFVIPIIIVVIVLACKNCNGGFSGGWISFASGLFCLLIFDFQPPTTLLGFFFFTKQLFKQIVTAGWFSIRYFLRVICAADLPRLIIFIFSCSFICSYSLFFPFFFFFTFSSSSAIFYPNFLKHDF